MNVSFDFNHETFQFDENGDPPGRYDIMNYQKMPSGGFEYVQVGSWNNRSLLWLQSPKFPEVRSRKLVRSVCAEECPKGFYKVSNLWKVGKGFTRFFVEYPAGGQRQALLLGLCALPSRGDSLRNWGYMPTVS